MESIVTTSGNAHLFINAGSSKHRSGSTSKRQGRAMIGRGPFSFCGNSDHAALFHYRAASRHCESGADPMDHHTVALGCAQVKLIPHLAGASCVIHPCDPGALTYATIGFAQDGVAAKVVSSKLILGPGRCSIDQKKRSSRDRVAPYGQSDGGLHCVSES